MNIETNRLVESHSWRSPKCLWAYAGIGLAWVLMTLASNSWGEFPIIDDWVYGLAVKSVLANGYYQFPSPSSANVGPQIYWGALFCLPFGFSYDALRLSTSVLGCAGGWMMYRVIRQLGAGNTPALLGALALIVDPMYFGMANSYMTDVPFTAVSLVAIFYFIRNLQTDSKADLAAGIVAALTAIMIRQLGLALLFGYAAAFLFKHGARLPNLLKMAALIAVGVLLHASYQYWMFHSGRTPALTIHSDPGNFLPIGNAGWILRITTFEMLSYAGFFVLPVAALFLIPATKPRSGPLRRFMLAASVAATLLVAALLVWKDRGMPSSVPGSVLKRYGIGPVMLRDTYILHLNETSIPQPMQLLWVLIGVVSIASAALIVHVVANGTLATWQGRRDAASKARGAPLVFCIAAIAAYALVMLYASTRFSIYDRYFLFFAPLLIAAMFASRADPVLRGKARVVVSSVILAGLAIMAVAATHDFAAATRLRWQALATLVHVDKIEPRRIDGGMEFDGSYLYRPDYVRTDAKSWWWVDGDDYVLASGPIPGYVEVRRYDFQRWLLQQPGRVVVLRRTTEDARR